MGGEDDVVFKTPLGNYKKWSEIVTALRDSLASSSSSKETRAASDPGGASSEKWSFVSSGSAGSGSSNHTLLTYDVIVNDDHDSTNSTIDTHHRRSHRPDIYLILVIGTVALLVLAILCFALYKAVQRLILKIPQTSGSAADSSSNAVEAAATATAASDTGGRSEAANQPGATNQSNPATTHPSTSSSGTLTRLANGFRSFQAANLRLTATLRSTASSKSDGDNPPPYEDDLPPSYEAALKMGGSSHVMTSCRSSSSSLGSAAGAAAAAESTSSVELQAPPTDETDGKKHKRTSKFNFSVV